MELEELIGKREKIKIIGITNNKKYYVGEAINSQYKIYIENTEDYEIEELMNSTQDCLIIDIKQNNLIGFILSNRKFENDIKKIEQKLFVLEKGLIFHGQKYNYQMEELDISIQNGYMNISMQM